MAGTMTLKETIDIIAKEQLDILIKLILEAIKKTDAIKDIAAKEGLAVMEYLVCRSIYEHLQTRLEKLKHEVRQYKKRKL